MHCGCSGGAPGRCKGTMLETWALHTSLTVLYNRCTHVQFGFVISSCHRKGLELVCLPCTLCTAGGGDGP